MMPSGSIKGDKTDKKPKPSEQSRGSYPTIETTAEGLNIRIVKSESNSYFKQKCECASEEVTIRLVITD